MATAHLLPVLDQVLDGLSAQSVARLQLTSRHFSESVKSLQPALLTRRGFGLGCSLQKVHAFEAALFSDAQGDPGVWNPGPNSKSSCNTLANDSEAASWLWLSGGTDWQSFQGGFSCVSELGIQPSWICFRVRVTTPSLSGASLTLSGRRHTWGFQDPVLVFSYRGDEAGKQRRCFVVQSGATQTGDVSHKCNVEPEVVSDKPYEVAMHLDWNAEELSVFIDGVRHIDAVPFKARSPIRFAAIHNWRSQARTAFSELVIGPACPFKLHGEVPGRAPAAHRQRLLGAISARCPCRARRRRWARAAAESSKSIKLSPATFAALTTAAVAAAAPMILHWAATLSF